MNNNTKSEREVNANAHVIQASLKLRRLRQAEIAKRLSVSPAVVSQVIHGTRTSKRIRNYIARVIGVPGRNLWPTT